MPRHSIAPLLLKNLLSNVIPERNFHHRCLVDEEIANAIKDDKGPIIGNFSNLNRLISRTRSFNQERQVVNHYAVIKFNIFLSKLMIDHN